MQQLNLYEHARQGRLKILAIFPHPDDESIPVGGTLADYASDPNVEITFVTVTLGEAGERVALSDAELASVRLQEFWHAIQRLGGKHSIAWRFPDGNLINCRKDLIDDLRELIIELEPDVVITYDESGFYGHPDHVELSVTIQELADSDELPDFHLYFIGVPIDMQSKLKLPAEMIPHPAWAQHRVPTHYYNYKQKKLTKWLAINVYQSQISCSHFIPDPHQWEIDYGTIEFFTKY